MPERPMRASVKDSQTPRPERIGQKQNEKGRRRQHEPEAQPFAVGLEALPRRRLTHDASWLPSI